MRVYANVRRQPPVRVAQGVPIPAPTGGWDAISPLPNMPADRAVKLQNWVPRPGWIEPRRGYFKQSTLPGATGTPVETVMAYNGSMSPNALFAVAGGTIYDATAVGTGVPTIVGGLANSRMQYVQFTAGGANYLIAVNGADVPKLWSGTNWADAVISGTGVDQTTFSQINQYNGRLWFVQKFTTNPCYMPVGQISGTAVVFPLGSFMRKGGYVVAIGTWTIDTRQTVDEYIAFITSRGEVLVYAGTDPSSDTTWSLVGIYALGRPIGERCFSRISGDLLIITVDGVVGMSEMLSTDRAAANRVSLTSIIMNAVATAAQSYAQNFGWQIIEYSLGTLSILNIPQIENNVQVQYVMNTITGAWSDFTGINACCWEVDAFDKVFFGGIDGIVYRWDVTSSDDGNPYTCRVETAYNSFGNAPQLKRYTAMQPLIFQNGNAFISMGISVDFEDSMPTPLSTDLVVFEPVTRVTDYWIGANGSGHYVSVITEVTLNDTEGFIVLQLNGWNMTAESGAYV